jgi:hypothetical protein
VQIDVENDTGTINTSAHELELPVSLHNEESYQYASRCGVGILSVVAC